MRVLIFALLCLVSFGSVKEQNQRLKKTNSALRQALRSLTVEQGRETKIGADEHGSKHGRETKIGADKHGSKHESEVGWFGYPGNHDPKNLGNYYYQEYVESETGRETKIGADKHGSKHDSAKVRAMALRSSMKSRRERAVGAGWRNGNCVYYGSSVVDHESAVVTDWGTGWSEDSCQSECDYSSTTKMCQYEFWSQKCSAIEFFTNEVYGDGSYDGLCYIK